MIFDLMVLGISLWALVRGTQAYQLQRECVEILRKKNEEEMDDSISFPDEGSVPGE